MKIQTQRSSFLSIAFAVLLPCIVTNAQTSVTTSAVSSDGMVQEIVPGTSQIVLTSSTSTTPVRYTYTKTTTFVDAAGNTVTYDAIKQNTPARIYYTKVGDSYIVTKFVVNPTATTTVVTPSVPVAAPPAPAQVIEETTTTTTTTNPK